MSDITITAVSSPAATDLLYPGGLGDVVATVDNPNSFEVAITALQLPSSNTFAAGYASASLASAKAGCNAGDSEVGWRFATSSSGSSHLLAWPLTLAPNSQRQVIFSDGATMGESAPAACEETYFQMPSLVGVTATLSNLPVTSGPATDNWSVAAGPGPTVSPPPSPTTTAPTRPPSTQPTATSVPAAPPTSVSQATTTLPAKAFWQPPPTYPSYPYTTPTPFKPPAPLPSGPGLLQRILDKLAKLVKPVGEVSLFTFAFVPFILLFLLIQRRIDRDDPKLALAPVYLDDVHFAERWSDV